MKMFVDTQETEFNFGKGREVRGNFIQHETENGTQYECDYYRITGNETFEQLYAKEQIPILKKFLADTDYIHLKCAEEGVDLQEAYPELIQQRIEARDSIRILEYLASC